MEALREPKFSVLIANYNNGKYLQNAIDSVIAQTYTNWEVIIVDDKSTDNSRSIYHRYDDDPRFHVYFNDCNKGCGYTKRRCVELANGDICGFLDSDDALVEDALRVMVEEHISNPELCMIYSLYAIYDESMNAQLGISQYQKQIPEGSSFLEEGDGAISHFVSFKKRLYQNTDGIDSYFIRAVDHNMYYRLEEVGPSKFIEKILYKYRTQTGNNISLGKNEIKACFWDVIAMSQACLRRDMQDKIEEIAFRGLEKAIEDYAQVRVNEATAKVRSSKAYRIGKFILKPISLFRTSR